MKEGLKAGSVFVGTVIGAGFATGREVMLYFKNCSPAVGVAAGFFLGFLCYVFMRVGALAGDEGLDGYILKKRGYLFDALMFICSFITFTAMFSGAEVLIMSTFNISHIGILSVVLAAFISISGMKSMKLLNAVAVPLIVVFIAVIFIKNGEFSKAGNLNAFSGVAYGAMNILPAGAVMARIGKTATKKSASVAGCCSGLLLGLMLFMIILIVQNRHGEMPTFDAARAKGLGIVSGAVIYLAVFTTMVSALENAADCLISIVPDKRLSTLTVCLMSYPLVLIFSFSQLIDYFYPVSSVAGILTLLLLCVRFCLNKRKGGVFTP